MNNELPNAGVGEVARMTSAGTGLSVFAAKVKSNDSYNIYKVRVVEILSAGQTPIEIGGELKATNLAEDFTQAGQLAVGTYVLVCSTGVKNVFYAQP
ncbi:MAG: hypothetical protein ABII09_07045 [Planctomycetota bacterium]